MDVSDDTNNYIQMNLFRYFLDEEQFSVREAIDLCKNIKKMPVNDESVRARIYEGVERGIFKKFLEEYIKLLLRLINLHFRVY